jgi:hypothetical protein
MAQMIGTSGVPLEMRVKTKVERIRMSATEAGFPDNQQTPDCGFFVALYLNSNWPIAIVSQRRCLTACLSGR